MVYLYLLSWVAMIIQALGITLSIGKLKFFYGLSIFATLFGSAFTPLHMVISFWFLPVYYQKLS